MMKHKECQDCIKCFNSPRPAGIVYSNPVWRFKWLYTIQKYTGIQLRILDRSLEVF